MRERQETPKWWLNGSDQAFAAHHFKLALNPDETRDSSSYYDGYTVCLPFLGVCASFPSTVSSEGWIHASNLASRNTVIIEKAVVSVLFGESYSINTATGIKLIPKAGLYGLSNV